MAKKKRIVIALGGNALGNTLPEQMQAVKITARAIVDLIEEGCDRRTWKRSSGRHDQQCNDRSDARRRTAAKHAALRLCGNEPGIHRIRSAECAP